MADNLTTLQLLTLSQTFRGDVVNQINRKVELLKFIPIMSGQGKNVAWAPDQGGELVESYSEGADVANYGTTTQASAILTWGLYRANPHVTQLAMDAAATSYNPTANKQQWAMQLTTHSAGLAKQLNKACYNGAGTTGLIAGLDVAIGSATNTYATIDRSTQAYWRPTVIDPSTPYAPGLNDLRDDLRQVYEACGENTDIAMCSPSVHNYIGSLFDNTRRRVEQVNSARGPVRLEVGFDAIDLNGMVFLKDVDATAGTIYYLNTSLMHLEVLPSPEQRMLVENDSAISANDGFGQIPFDFVYEMLAKTGASEKATIRSTCQLVVTRPNAFAVRKNVAIV